MGEKELLPPPEKARRDSEAFSVILPHQPSGGECPRVARQAETALVTFIKEMIIKSGENKKERISIAERIGIS